LIVTGALYLSDTLLKPPEKRGFVVHTSKSLESTEFSRLFAFSFQLSHGLQGGCMTYGSVSAYIFSLSQRLLP